MQIGLAFYIIMLFWLIFGIMNKAEGWRPNIQNILLFALLLLLGWHEFGPPLHG